MSSDRLIIRLSIFVIFSGLIGLYLICMFVAPPFVKLAEIDNRYIGKTIITKGMVSKSFLSKSKTLFLELKENKKKISVVMFNVNKNLFKKGDSVSVKGEIHIYKGTPEIIARDIKKI
ncbi:MAG: exodeoxyribonuclease VII large subunit [Candidatus Aenigmarchaeota archaeon]|nr:exodeoxyribonuclease VII large subunit [Candidatus Aenigmarchaeota archaeon]